MTYTPNGDGTYSGGPCKKCGSTAVLLDPTPACLKCFNDLEKQQVEEDRQREDQRRVLAVLARSRWPMKRRQIEDAALGPKAWNNVFRVQHALRQLVEDGYVRNAYNPNTAQFHGCWEATEKGREHAPQAEAFHPSMRGGAS